MQIIMNKISLIGKYGQGKFVLIDEENFEWLNKFRWYGKPDGGYPRSTAYHRGVHTSFKMHRIIMNAKPGQIVDHINGNVLDNRRENLRFVTSQQNSINSKTNCRNKSGYKGVFYRKDRKRWVAKIRINKARISLGTFNSVQEAFNAYKERAMKEFPEYIRF